LHDTKNKVNSKYATNFPFSCPLGVKHTTCDVVEHKYGGEASDAVGQGLDVVGTVGQMGREASKLTVKGMAKTVAKESGKELINRDDKKALKDKEE